jgi:hypothetical protein
MMKRLFILLLILSSLTGYSQTITQYIGTKSTTVQAQGSLKVDSAFYLPTVTKASPSWPALRYSAADSSLYYWTGFQWIQAGTGAGTANLYNANGALTGNRTLSGGGYTLSLSNLGNYSVHSTNGTNGQAYLDMQGYVDLYATNTTTGVTTGLSASPHLSQFDLYANGPYSLNVRGRGDSLWLRAAKFVFNGMPTTTDAAASDDKALHIDARGRVYQKTASGSSLPSQTGNAGKVLTTDGTTASWTGTARYSFTNLQDGQLIKAQISGGDTTFVNFTPTYGTGSASEYDSIAVTGTTAKAGFEYRDSDSALVVKFGSKELVYKPFSTSTYTGGVGSSFSETFNAADTADMAGRTLSGGSGTWVAVAANTGTIGIASNAAQLTSSSSTIAKYYVETGARDGEFIYTIGTASSSMYALLAYEDESNFIQVNLSTCAIQVIENGSGTTLYGGDGSSLSGDQVRVVITGTTIHVYRNAVDMNTNSAPATITGTKHGIYFYQDATGSIDNLTMNL